MMYVVFQLLHTNMNCFYVLLLALVVILMKKAPSRLSDLSVELATNVEGFLYNY